MLDAASLLPNGPIVLQNYWGSAIYPPTTYAVPAVALFILNHFGFDPLDTFFGGRIANAVVYVMVGALAIWLTPVGKFAFALVLLLPMALSQAGSFSADVQVFSFTAMICALLAREAARGSPAILGLVAAAGLLILVATTKAPMIALVLPLAAISWRRSRLLAIVLMTTVIAAFVLWTVNFVFTDSSAARVASAGVSSSKQFSFLLSHPFSIIDIALNTIKLMWWRYIFGIIGIFGWLDTPLGHWFYYLSILCVVIVAMATAFDGRIGHNISFLLSTILATALTFGALYLSWSKVGSDIVVGVQGRYFIPILFPAILALPGIASRFRLQSVVEPASILAVLILWITSSTYVPLVLVNRFYLH